MVFIREVGFVWRQLELAFFGALTSVGALFILEEKLMDEKILIKSEMDKKARTIFHILMGICFSIGSILLLSLFEEKEYGYYYTYTKTGFQSAFDGNAKALAAFIIGCELLLTGIVDLIIFLIHRKCQITVTEKNVRGTALFGKEVVLPIYMISAYSTRSFMSTIAVATSSGLTKFALIENYAEIGSVLSKMINDRQDKTIKTEASDSNIDALVKLKTLLDQGIITQEEFDAKKKQLLGF